jgi:hypothetical protein
MDHAEDQIIIQSEDQTDDRQQFRSQIFRVKIPVELIRHFLNLYGLDGFDTEYTFTRKDLVKRNVIEKVNNFKSQLEEYYIPCKFNKYMDEINDKRLITILRQMIKLYDYTLESFEKYSYGERYLIYKLKRII